VFLNFGDRQTGRLTNRQADKQMDSTDALSRSRCCERRLDNSQTIQARAIVTIADW